MWQPKNKNSAVTDWVDATAKLPVAFAQVREDSAIDVELVQSLNREARVVMIASGGETAAMLSALPIAQLRLVDVNRSQLNLTRLKLQLLTTANRNERLQLLGHLPMDADQRSGELARRLSALKLPADALGPPTLVARHGPDHCGRYEWLFARMRACLLDQADAVRQLMMLADADAQAAMIAPGSVLARHLKEAYEHVMDLPRLARIFGPDATANRRQSFADHFFAQTCQALRSMPAADNPFLHQGYLGEFSGPCWPWLEQPVSTPPARLDFVHAGMDQALASLAEDSCDLVHLSNILDWIKPEEAGQILNSACQCLAPGGLVVIRQLNSRLDIRQIPSGFVWLEDWSAELHRSDRSFFYRALHVGTKQ